MKSSVKCAVVPEYRSALVIGRLSVVALAIVSATASALVGDVGRALDRLSAVPKPFSLAPGVRLEKREAVAPLVVDRRATLVDSAERVFHDNDLVLDTAPGLQMRVTASGDGRGFQVLAEPSSRSEPRTFGVMRRLKMALLPIMYKLGVITTLLTLLTVFALKGLTIGVLLLIMGSVGLIHKFKTPYYHEGGHGQHKDVHVHVHGGGGGHHGIPVYHSGESYWDRTQPPGQPPYWDRTQPPGQPPWGPPPDGQLRYPHQLDVTKKNPWDQFIS